MRTGDTRLEKFTNLGVTLYNFSVSMVISHCQLKVIVLWFYEELNAVHSKNLELSHGISHILPVFSKIIVYFLDDKMILELKNVYCSKSLYSGYQLWKLQNLPRLGEVTQKKKKAHFKTISLVKSWNLPIFDEIVAKNSAFKIN